MPLKLAIGTGRLPVERAYELLVATGEHHATDEPGPPGGHRATGEPGDVPAAPQPGVPAGPDWSGPEPVDPTGQTDNARRAPVAPVIFSHAKGEQQ
ncbi:hypothetical protein CIK06_10275 [Plantactinospora sp. KBS50]|nr:hypothetical protein CIK06_10275 [Plantactinospora sp. KBS50]